MTRPLAPKDAGGELTQQAVALLAEASALQPTLHLVGVRDGYRAQLEQVVRLASQALEEAPERRAVALLHGVLVQAHTARAEDARYGAGQLARGAQRAPTLADCDDGWERVAEIVATAAAAATAAAHSARQLGTARAKGLAQRAAASASAARQIVLERNRSYTFHADPGFSFGEGWYLAAAALFAGLAIQIRPGAVQEVQARRFLHDAGLAQALCPYRSRPASPKHLTHLIAATFRADAAQAQATLRAAFLGDAAPADTLQAWIADKMGGRAAAKVLLWVRTGAHDSLRNTDFAELRQLADLVVQAGCIPILFGDHVPLELVPPGAVNLCLCWKEPLFQGPEMRRAQLQLFEELRCRHGLLGQLGVTTAGMDGPALLGLPTMYLTAEANVRLGLWVGAVPGYREVVRGPGYLDTIRTTLRQWQQ